MNKLVLIDSNAILHRAYHALPKTFRTRKGEPINAVYGFVSMLLKIITDLKPTHVACCFDLKEPTFRKKAFAEYQAHRPEMDDNLSSQFDKAKDVVRSFGIPIYEKAGFEADDVIGTLAFQATKTPKRKNSKIPSKKKIKKGKPNARGQKSKVLDEVVIVTGDKDILQLVNEKVKVYMPVKGLSEAQLMGPDEVYKKMGVRPDQVDEYKALVGDPSDNYKGVPGIGPKTAERLLSKYTDLDEIYSNLNKIDEKVVEKLKENERSARMSQKLARIITNVDINPDWEDMDDWSVGRKETIELFETFGFKTLTKRVKEFGEKTDGGVPDKKNLSKEEVEEVAVRLVKLLGKSQYAIRGTASLVLQGLDMVVDDIDIICVKKTALSCNKLLKDYLVRKVEFTESEKFKSYFGEFNCDGVKVEIMGEWQIKKNVVSSMKNVVWSKKYNADSGQVAHVEIDKFRIPVTKIETELSMFSDMGRWNAYHKIKKQIEEKNQGKLF